MKQAYFWLPFLVTFAAACGGRSSLNTFEDGVPAYLSGGHAGRPVVPGDGGSDDAGSTEDAATGGGGGGVVGDPCGADDECQGDSPACLQSVDFGGFAQIDFPGGYCIQPGCEDDADCPDGSACFAATGMTACNKLCESDAECRTDEGYSCGSVPLGGDSRTFCIPEFSFGGL